MQLPRCSRKCTRGCTLPRTCEKIVRAQKPVGDVAVVCHAVGRHVSGEQLPRTGNSWLRRHDHPNVKERQPEDSGMPAVGVAMV